MIIFEKLEWSNMFSYGANNGINFTSEPITQLIGLNGHGKSSVPLILEEVLFNKNSNPPTSKDACKAKASDYNQNLKSYSIESHQC